MVVLNQSIGDRLMSRRSHLGLTRDQIAQHIGISISAVQAHENGRNALKPENIMSYARVLKVSPNWILTGSDDDHYPTPENSPVPSKAKSTDSHSNKVTTPETRTVPTSGTTSPSPAAPSLAGRTFEVSRAAGFEAAHHLAPKDPDHPYGRLHGHSFRVEIAVSGVVKPGEDWVADFAHVGDVLAKVTDTLDHSYLNEIEGLELPTLERICVWIADRIIGDLPTLTRVSVSRPSLSETCTLRLAPGT
jgi:6-pyruvoyltetrahydropterin/6-carboxytetrahydropterin synthase